MPNKETNKTNEAGFSAGIIYATAFIAFISIMLSMYGLLSTRGEGVKFYQFGVIEKEIQRVVTERAHKHTQGLVEELRYMVEQIKENEKAYEQNKKGGLKKKIEKQNEDYKNKAETYQRVYMTTVDTLTQEMIEERLPRSIRNVRKQKGCRALIPLDCRFYFGNSVGVFTNAPLQMSCQLGMCIDAADDCTEQILKEMNIDYKQEGAKQETDKKKAIGTSKEGEAEGKDVAEETGK